MSLSKPKSKSNNLYGAATIGEKGQIVIPKQAREKMNLKKGDHLLVFGLHDGMLAVAKPGHIEAIAAHLSKILKKNPLSKKKTHD